MIKYIVSDLDGTLFKGHGETIFDLTQANRQAIQRAKEHGIHFCVASGRTYLHGKRILELNGFENDVLCTGLNGSIIYDHGVVCEKRYMTQALSLRIINELEKHLDKFKNVQIQDLEEGRAYYYYDREPSFKYRKECATLGIGKYEEISLAQFVSRTLEIGKISCTSATKEDSFQLEAELRSVFQEKIGYSRSSDTFLELHHPQSSKANFINYLKTKYDVSSDEIACVGDSYNDMAMFELCNYSFVLQSGDEMAKASAKYQVQDVAQAIDMCIAMKQ